VGHHYVPQRYLRNFEERGQPGFIWQYTKKDGEGRLLPIRKVAQSREFYEADVEIHLANEVEPQGSQAMERLLQGKTIGVEERLNFALYLGVAMKRVPKQRERAWKLVPGALAEVMANFRKSVHEAAASMPAEPDKVSRLLQEADRIERKFEAEPPQCVEDQIRFPLPSEGILGAIITMDWRLCVTDGPQLFITSDNPFFFTTGCGLGKQDSEFLILTDCRY
jgi:Protein of unknown function (DUF4238)